MSRFICHNCITSIPYVRLVLLIRFAPITQLKDPNTKSVITQEMFDLVRLPEVPSSISDTVSFCHITKSATNPFTTITVPENAAQKHRDHGDYPGTCEDAANDPEFLLNHEILIPDDGKVRRDPKCSKINTSCRPTQVISADKLRDYTSGPAETQIIGNVLNLNQKTGRYVINKDTWTCLWDKLIVQNQGPTVGCVYFLRCLFRGISHIIRMFHSKDV